MIKKRLFALAMTAVMMLSTSVVAFAADDTKTENISSTLSTAIEATGTLKQASIKVTVPTTSKFVINPYKLSVTDPVASSAQVISPEYTIENAGEVDLSVDMTVKATAENGLNLATAPVTSTETKKNLFLYVQVKQTLDSGVVTAIQDQHYTSAGAPYIDDSTTFANGDGTDVFYAIDKSALEAVDGQSYYVISDDYKALITETPYAYTLKTSTGSYNNKTKSTTTKYVLETYSFLKDGYNKDASMYAASANGTAYKAVGTIENATDGTNKSITYQICGSTAVNPTEKWTGKETATLTLTFNFTPVVK
jgi:hypothetical protein